MSEGWQLDLNWSCTGCKRKITTKCISPLIDHMGHCCTSGLWYQMQPPPLHISQCMKNTGKQACFEFCVFPLGPGLSLGREKRMKTKKADTIRAVWVLDWLWFCSSWTHLNSMGDIQTAWVTANKCRPVNSCRWLQWNVCSPFAEVPQLHRAEGALQQGVPWPCREDPSPEDAVTTDIWARHQPSAPDRKK